MVVGAEEGVDVFQPCRSEVFRGADRHPVVRVIVGIQSGSERHDRKAVRPVLVVLPTLVEHDIALGVEPFGGQRRQQVPHSIRFHPEGEIERARRNHLPVVGAIRVGRAVQHSTGPLNGREIARIVMLGSFEHQMLEQVCEAGTARALIL